MEFKSFHYKTYDDLKTELCEIGITLPFSEDYSVLHTPIKIGKKLLPNRLMTQPMEGYDGNEDGTPGELSLRRYNRFSSGGSALIWVEAMSVVPEGRANPRQLCINEKTSDALKNLVETIKENCLKTNGFEPYVVGQITHSGRYAKPEGKPAPIIVYNNPIFEKDNPIDSSRIATDDYLDTLPQKFGDAAKIAKTSGFDAVDIKCAHRYLFSELCSAYNRPGKYGGSFENRTKLFLDSVAAAKVWSDDDFLITSRLNLYDGFEYPYGFGVKEGEGIKPDWTESVKLIEILINKFGYTFMDFTMGNPYFNPHVNRPYDKGKYIPAEHPLEGVARMIDGIGHIKKTFPDLTVIGAALTYLRQFIPNVAAGVINEGLADMLGFGREAFAYPDFANDIKNKEFSTGKCCVSCSKCTDLKGVCQPCGCVVRDNEVYLPYYKKYCLQEIKL